LRRERLRRKIIQGNDCDAKLSSLRRLVKQTKEKALNDCSAGQLTIQYNCMGRRALHIVGRFVVASLLCSGCGSFHSSTPSVNASASGDGTVAAEPIGAQMTRVVPDLRGQRFSNLLNFESRTDTVFLASSGLHASIDSSVAHTGRSSLKISGSGKTSVKLSALLGNRPFPGEWTLAGAYFYSDKPGTRVAVMLEEGTRTISHNVVSIVPGRWSSVMLDLSTIVDSQQKIDSVPVLTFSIEQSQGASVWCDDVVLIDNTQWLVGSDDQSSAGPDQWTIRKRGFNIICDVPGKFTMRLASAEGSENGWRVEQANEMRACFTSSGKNKTLTIFPDGRSYWDGVFRPLAADLRAQPLWAQQQDSPAEITIPETMGRVERRTSGDENNDGYNEAKAAYEIIATGPRLEVTISPRSVKVIRPMLEISGLPPGKAVVTLEGRLIEHTLRLQDGTLLADIPAIIERPATVDVHVK
jgi:hypothetical protein